MGSPRALKRRPRTFFPTGTPIGLSVSKASMPRASPSVGDIETQRTMPPLICMETSQVTRRSWVFVAGSAATRISMALRMEGTLLRVNLMSIIGPTTCTIFPMLGLFAILNLALFAFCFKKVEYIKSVCDLREFLGDHKLPCLIVLQ